MSAPPPGHHEGRPHPQADRKGRPYYIRPHPAPLARRSTIADARPSMVCR